MAKRCVRRITYVQWKRGITVTKKDFMTAVSNGREDILQQMLDLLNEMKIDYCVIGGLAVDAYVEPVVSLDLDLADIFRLVEAYPHLKDLLPESLRKEF